jgi:hypothetical protein
MPAIVVVQEILVLLEVLEVAVLLDMEDSMDREPEMVALEEHWEAMGLPQLVDMLVQTSVEVLDQQIQ